MANQNTGAVNRAELAKQAFMKAHSKNYLYDTAFSLIDYENDIKNNRSVYTPAFSPNNIKTMVFGTEGVLATYYVNRQPKGITWEWYKEVYAYPDCKSPLACLTGRNLCKNIQEIIIILPNQQTNLLSFKDNVKLLTSSSDFTFVRLRGVYTISGTSMSKVSAFLRDYENLDPKKKPVSCIDYTEGIQKYGLNFQSLEGLPYNNDWRTSHGLTVGSQTAYPTMDGKGGTLYNHMSNLVKEAKRAEASSKPVPTEAIEESTNTITAEAECYVLASEALRILYENGVSFGLDMSEPFQRATSLSKGISSVTEENIAFITQYYEGIAEELLQIVKRDFNGVEFTYPDKHKYIYLVYIAGEMFYRYFANNYQPKFQNSSDLRGIIDELKVKFKEVSDNE